MKRIRNICATAVMVLACGADAAFAQATATSSANASIVTAIGLSNTVALDFGDVVAGATAGTGVVGSAGARSNTGGATLGNASGAAAASFNVTGAANATYAITLPSSTTVSTGGTTPVTMTVNTFTKSVTTGTLSASGTGSFKVGATLQVGASQALGAYTGSFTVTVAYN